MKKGQTAAAILLLSLALNGCGGGNGTTAFAPTESSLYVTKEGTVTSADVESYENDYYSADELKAYAEEMLGVFESGNQSGSSEKKAEIAECTVKDGTAKLLITFPDAEEYLRFAEEYPDTESGIRIESLDVVSVPDGVEKGYIVGSTFYKAGDENTEVSAVDITKQKKLYVVCVKGSAKIAECTVKDGTAKLLITFPDAEEYLRFAEEYPDTESGIRIESLDVVSVPDGVEKGYIVGSTFYKAGDENTEVSAVDITKQKKLYVVCVKGSAKIQTDGQVRYVSEGVTLNGSMAETPEGETSYIIFK